MSKNKIVQKSATLSDNKVWMQANNVMLTGATHGFVSKMDIGESDVYIQTGWLNGRMVWIDITLSRSVSNMVSGFDSHATAMIDSSRFDLARSALEVICRHASEMLQSGMVGIEHFVRCWRGISMYPSGPCPQLNEIVSGPTDAAARMIEKNLSRWTDTVVTQEALRDDPVVNG